jgi:hypothetical protein
VRAVREYSNRVSENESERVDGSKRQFIAGGDFTSFF